jgi:anti-sigma28 factor (negative regulator of flagellin synthesis)
MVNDIKFNTINAAFTPKTARQDAATGKITDKKQADIMISNQLTKFVQAALAEDSNPIANTRLDEIKNKIASQNYNVDTSKLAETLYTNLIAKIKG